MKEYLDVCDAGRKDETLAGNRIVGGTDSVPGLHPSIGAIIKENVKICFFSLENSYFMAHEPGG